MAPVNGQANPNWPKCTLTRPQKSEAPIDVTTASAMPASIPRMNPSRTYFFVRLGRPQIMRHKMLMYVCLRLASIQIITRIRRIPAIAAAVIILTEDWTTFCHVGLSSGLPMTTLPSIFAPHSGQSGPGAPNRQYPHDAQ